MLNTHPKQGCLFMVVAPSGAGKSTLVHALLEQEPGIALSVSYTTRTPRPKEREGCDYHFISVDDFRARCTRGEFLEWAEVHGHYYGTSQQDIIERMQTGCDVLLEIDWQGAHQVRTYFPQAVGIFILPPSITALEDRLKKREQDDPHVIMQRILAAGSEIAHASDFEYVIINQIFSTALSEMCAIIKATRCRFSQQAHRHRALFIQLDIHANR